MEVNKMKKKIISLVRNSFTNDARIDKTVTSLIKFGHDVVVIAEKAFVDLPVYENDKYPIIRVPLFSSIYAKMSTASIVDIEKKSKQTLKNRVYFLIKNCRFRLMLISFLNTVAFNSIVFWVGLFNKPDIIYANDLDTLLVAFLIAKFTKAKVIYDSHEIWFYGGVYNSSTKLRQFIWRIIEKKLIHRVAAVVTISQTSADHLKKTYNLEEVFVVRNCPKFQDVERSSLLREEFNISPHNIILIYHGLLKRIRGIFDIVDAVHSLQNVSVIFMGHGRDKKEMYDYINTMELQDRIFIKDTVPYKQVLEVVASADVGLQPFHYTFNHYCSLPNKLTECIMAGIANIGSNFPEMEKAIKGDDIGFTHEQQNIQQLREVIIKIQSDRNLLQKFKSNALKIRKNYCWENDESVIKKLVEELKSLHEKNSDRCI